MYALFIHCMSLHTVICATVQCCMLYAVNYRKIQLSGDSSQNSYCCQFKCTRKLHMLYTVYSLKALGQVLFLGIWMYLLGQMATLYFSVQTMHRLLEAASSECSGKCARTLGSFHNFVSFVPSLRHYIRACVWW